MYKLTRIPFPAEGFYPDINYQLTEDGEILYQRVIIRMDTENSVISGGLFRGSSEVKVPTGQIEIYDAPLGMITTSTGIYPVMKIPVAHTAIIGDERLPLSY